MELIVCLKRVPDTGARIEIEKDDLEIKADIPWILNPYDEFAVEEAIRIKERFGGGITLSYPLLKRKGLILNGDIREEVKVAVRFLKDEAKLI